MNKIIPLFLCIFASISTLIGYLLIYVRYDKENLIKYSLAVSAGVMISVSLFDLIPESISLLNSLDKRAFIYLLLSIIVGSIIPIVLNNIVFKEDDELYRIGLLSMFTIVIHNIPEGVITYLSASHNFELGFVLTLAMALHNIPEGVMIAVPIYFATKSRGLAFKYSLLSALSEPFGAFIAALFLQSINNTCLGFILGIVAGLMVTVSVNELLPKAFKYDEKNKILISFLFGVLVMYIIIKLIK